ncbi:MAG: type 1 glutamine amidotransferase [Acidobacteria bacterium]|nr:type 1 glutamine amidotransferase [Acidobacteriota bacterium]MBI3281388.1 type 1 glutamine amidotransferase [Acidobacteriota bacterium]
MRILTIRHVPFEHIGRIAETLDSAKVDCTYLDLYREPAAACSLDSFAGVIVMGGPMSANDNIDYIRRELCLLEEALSLGKPVLGVCLGAQLLAKAAGANVFRNPVKEIGWASIHWTEAARQDRLFAGLEQPETVFHWHGETFDLPRRAEWLAWSDSCRNQAFKIGRAYGLQFHLEVTPEMVSDWLRQEANCADVAGLADPIDPGANVTRMTELSATVFGRWCEMVKSDAPARRPN